MKKIITKLILKYFLKDCREITKVTEAEEYDLYLMKHPDTSLKLLKTLITTNMIRYFEAESDEERLIVKGEIVCLKKIKYLNSLAWELEKIFDKEERLNKWKKLKAGKRRPG